MSVRPALLLSLPRSGSTLAQRVIASHPKVASASEPWLLLPLAYTLREEGARAEYSHPAAARSIAQLAEQTGGREAYLRELGAFAERVYTRLSPPEAEVFLDKTPRYHLIARELGSMLPDARTIFLWRNPLAVVASMLETFRLGQFEPELFRLDLVDGLLNLTEAWAEAGEEAIAVRYEDLVSADRGEGEWRRIFDHLSLEFDRSVLERFASTEMTGHFGDPTGPRRFDRISDEPQDAWMQALSGPVRKRWCRGYLERLGPDRLEAMGYELDDLLAALDTVRGRRTGAVIDGLRLARSRSAERARRRAISLPDHAQPLGAAWGRPTGIRRRLRLRLRGRYGGEESS